VGNLISINWYHPCIWFWLIKVLKVFRILAQLYRNRHRQLGLRFNLLAGLYNHELELSMS